MSLPLRIFTIVGTRPEAIKLAPVIQLLAARPKVEHKVVLSGQHRELVHSALSIFGILPDLDLALMHENQRLSDLTARALVAFEALYRSDPPDWVITQGDTTTALAGSLAAFYNAIPVAHVEAGLRTDDLLNPFPEEMNRRFIDEIASLHFAPTEHARRNLLNRGIGANSTFVTGNTGIDALLLISARQIEPPGCLAPSAQRGLRIVLVTAHRRESFGLPLADICKAIRVLVERNPDVGVVYAVHPNPNVRAPVHTLLGEVDRVYLVDAVDYEAFVGLMKHCVLILTDSGGIQEEAPSLGKPVLVLRRTTERVEAIEAGTARIVGTDPAAIVAETERLLHDAEAYRHMANARNPFGDGHAAARIVDILVARDPRGQPVTASTPAARLK